MITALAHYLIKTYQRLVSPLLHHWLILPGGCRFQPTCSAYGLYAIRQYGLLTGFMFLLRRFLRCHPWSSGGYDPLPRVGLK